MVASCFCSGATYPIGLGPEPTVLEVSEMFLKLESSLHPEPELCHISICSQSTFALF